MGIEKVVLLPTPRRLPARPQAAPVVPFQALIDARDRIASALLGGTRRVLVTGPAGTGKTILLDQVARVLRAAGRTVTVRIADVDPTPPEAGATLFVDEADRLSPAKLRDLWEAPGVVLLAGLPGTLNRRSPAGTVHLALEPLGREGARTFIAAWLAATDRTVADLDSGGVRRLVELSGGVPRLLSTLLAASAWVAETSGAPVISAEHVQEAAELRSVLTVPDGLAEASTRRRPGMAWLLIAIGVVAIGFAAVVAAPHLLPMQAQRLAGDWAQGAERWVRRELGYGTPPGRDLPLRPAPAVVAAPAPAVLVPPTPAVSSVPDVPGTASPEGATAAQAPTAEPPIVAAHPLAPDDTAANEALPVETVEFLIRRGREMLALADVSAARLLFRRAADAGSTDAMVQLGQTFDPAFLAGIGAGAQADRAQMLQWFGRAAAAGNAEAAARLENKTSR